MEGTYVVDRAGGASCIERKKGTSMVCDSARLPGGTREDFNAGRHTQGCDRVLRLIHDLVAGHTDHSCFPDFRPGMRPTL